jgi:hypothetical protein
MKQEDQEDEPQRESSRRLEGLGVGVFGSAFGVEWPHGYACQ